MILANTNTRDYRLNLYPYLCLLEDSEYVDIMIQVIQPVHPPQPTVQWDARQLRFISLVIVWVKRM